MALERDTRRRIVVGALVVTAAVLALVTVLFVYGTPQSSPSASGASALPESGTPLADAESPAGDSSAASADGQTGAAGGYAAGEVDPAAEAPPADPDSPLAIEIPGCVCHSEDPELVKKHSEYRMNQCAGCHLGGVEMGK